jgi:hypothetical protein
MRGVRGYLFRFSTGADERRTTNDERRERGRRRRDDADAMCTSDQST